MIIWPILAAVAATTLQPSPSVDQDVHCLAAFILFSETVKEDQKSGFLSVAMYYIGRIDGQAPRFDLEKALSELLSNPDYRTKTLPADALRCGTEMQTKGGELKKLGKALQDRSGS